MPDSWMPLLPFAVFFAWLLFFMRRTPACPDCHKPLSAIQSPLKKTPRQWLEGGYICANCGCESDIAGKKVAAGAAPQRRSILTAIGLLAVTGIPAAILTAILIAMQFQR